MNKRNIFIFTLALTLAAGAGAQTVYRWVDGDGVVHYGARPPQGVEATAVNTAAASGGLGVAAEEIRGGAGQAAGTAGEPEISYAEQRRRERAKRQQEAMQQDAERKGKCAAMQAQRAALEPSPRVIVRDAEGNPTRMDDNDRLAKLEEARKYLAENCQ